MGLFNFLKTSPVSGSEPAATFEALLAQAVRDPAHQPEFYRRLLLESLVVITSYNPVDMETRTRTTEPDETIDVVSWEDNVVPIFTSADRIFDGKVIQQQVSIVQMKGRSLLQMLQNKTLLLNPFSNYSKELLSAEIMHLLAGRVLDAGYTIEVAKKTTVLLSQPATYPTDLTQALARLLSQQPRVRAAYLGWLHNPTGDEPPHYVICLDVEGEMRAISKEVGYVARKFLQSGEFVDIVQSGQSSFTDYFLTTKPFYKR